VAGARLADPKLWQMGLDIPATAFGAGWQEYRVFSTVTGLLLIACMLVGGLLGDVLGRRRVLLGGALVATVAGPLTAVAPGVPWFVAARAVDVAAGAVAFPLTLAVVRLTFTGRERPLALLVYTAVTGAALLVALLAIVIEDAAGWRATLVLPTAAGAVGTYLTWRHVPESRAAAGVLRRAATAAAWALVLLPLTLGAAVARLAGTWANPVALTALALSAAGLAVLARSWRGRVRRRLVGGLGQRRRHLLSVMLLAQALLSFGLTGFALQLYGFFSAVQRYGYIVAGLALLPLLAGVLLVARPAPRWALRRDARRLLAGGLALMGGALLASALLRPAMPYWPLALPMVLFGCGYLVAQTAWLTVYMSAMPDAVVGASAGLSKATAATGAALGGALLGTVLLYAGRADFARRLAAEGLTAAQRAAAGRALDAVLLADAASDRSLPPPGLAQAGLLAAYDAAYTVGVATALLLAAALCLLAAGLVWLALDARPVAPAADAAADEALAELI
jgi:MFS transporter, DHA2 family, multidrug resistance protein